MGKRSYRRSIQSYRKFEDKTRSLSWDSFYRSLGGAPDNKLKMRIERTKRLSIPKKKSNEWSNLGRILEGPEGGRWTATKKRSL